MTRSPITPAALTRCVAHGFGVEMTDLVPVVGGADTLASVWRGRAVDGRSYAVKASDAGLAVGLRASSILCGNGVRGVPEPVGGRDGQLWATLGAAQVSLAPWVSARRAFDHEMTAIAWRSFGALLAQIHGLGPSSAGAGLPAVDFEPSTVGEVRRLDRQLRTPADDSDSDGASDRWKRPSDPTVELTSVWRTHASRLIDLAEATAALGRDLSGRASARVMTHGDAHLGNVLVGDDDQVWLLDWDGAALAPPERDLMFVLGGVLTDRPVNAAQQSWFLDGYGPVAIDLTRLAYFTCDRAVEDVTSWAASVLDERSPLEDRVQALSIFRGLMTSTGIVAIAEASLRHLDVG